MTHEINPEDFNPTMEVAACFLEYKTQFVILLRNKDPFRDTWCLPGGKVEEGEHVLDAVAREIKQEIGYDLPIDRICSASCTNIRYPGLDFVYNVFRSVLLQPIEIMLNHEHKDFLWVTAENALNYDLTPGLREVVEWFYNPQNKLSLADD